MRIERVHVVTFAGMGFALAVTLLLIELVGCTPGQRQLARTVIDVALATCIAAHGEIEDEPTLKSVCQWTDDLAPAARELLRARRTGQARAGASRASCGPDGGI